MSLQFLEVRNWRTFQHYKHRDPPWVRLYVSLLTDYEFTQLPDNARSHLVSIWLLASRHGGKIPYDPPWIARAIAATDRVDIQQLIRAGWLIPHRRDEDASTPLAEGEQSASEMLPTMFVQMSEERRVDKQRREEQLVESDASTLVPVVSVSNGHKSVSKIARGHGLTVAEATSRIAAFVSASQAGGSMDRKQEARRRALAAVAFAYWSARLNHPRALLDAKRERRLMERLKESGDHLDELLWAIDGVQKDPWLMGTSPTSTKAYTDLATIFRDREQIERLASLCPGYRRGEPHPEAQVYLRDPPEQEA